MRVLFHPEFPQDVRRFADGYAQISPGLAERFRREIDEAIEAIKAAPAGAGHYLNLGSKVVPELRRRNLRAFPFFVLYGHRQPLRPFDLANALFGSARLRSLKHGPTRGF